jgi:hypothetical protein
MDTQNLPQPQENSILTDPEKAKLMLRASEGLLPEVRVELVTDPDRAATLYREKAYRRIERHVWYPYERNEREVNPEDFARTARQAIESGSVLVQVTRMDGLRDLSHLYTAVEELRANSNQTA